MTPFDLLVLGLACWICTAIVVESEIMRPIRERCTHPKLRYLVGCHLCSGIWVAAGLVAAWFGALAPARFVVTLLAVKGIGHGLLVLQRVLEASSQALPNERETNQEARPPLHPGGAERSEGDADQQLRIVES